MTTLTDTEDRRQQAVERLEKRAAFWPHLFAYVLVNAVLVVIWLMTSDGGLFWPAFPMLGWGIGLFFHAWDAFRRPMTEDRIRAEMRRLDR
jgi:cytochrome b561